MHAVDAALETALAGALAADSAARVWVAYSGGVDSTALLLAAHRWASARGVTLRAVHVNHGLHAQADAWVQHCQVHCERLAVDLAVCTVQVGGEGGVEAAARVARYAAFAELLERDDVLLLAHHADDQAETVLMRLLRGTGGVGLSGMRSRRAFGNAWLIRPFLQLARTSLSDYVQAANAAVVADPSNTDVRYVRAWQRERLAPVLRERWPRYAHAIADTAAQVAEQQDVLATFLTPILSAATGLDGGLSLAALRAHDEPVALALLDAWLRPRGVVSPRRARLRELYRQLIQAASDRAPRVVFGARSVRRFRERVYVVGRIPSGIACTWDGAAPLETPVGTLSRVACVQGGLRWPGSLQVTYRAARMATSAGIRVGGHQRTWKEVFRAAGVAPWLRGSWPLLNWEGRVICVPGITTADDFCQQDGQYGFAIKLDPNV